MWWELAVLFSISLLLFVVARFMVKGAIAALKASKGKKKGEDPIPNHKQLNNARRQALRDYYHNP